MPKLVLTDITNTESTSLVSAVNANNTAVETALENTLSRDGTGPNAMASNLDMGNFLITNLATPTNNSNAATKEYVDTLVGDLDGETLDAAIAAAVTTTADKAATLTYRNEALAYRDQAASYVGAATSAQRLSTARSFTFTGGATGSVAEWDGSTNFTVALTIPDNSVALAKLVNSGTDNVVVGRVNPSSGVLSLLTGAQVTSILSSFGTGTSKGAVDRGGTSNTTEYLRRDGNWATPPSSTVPSAGSYSADQGSFAVGNIIIKYGRVTPVSQSVGSTSVAFSTAFPTACLNVQLTTDAGSGGVRADRMFQLGGGALASGFDIYLNDFNSATSSCTCYWLAIGY